MIETRRLRPEEGRRPLSVSELAEEIRRQLRPLSAVLVRGEVSGLRRTARGNYHFAIRDASALVQAFLFGNDARRLGLVPEDGQVFVFRGRVELWQDGRLSLVVDYVQYDDVGQLRAQLEALRRRLELEGAFAPERKRPLPFLPRAVALVTSPTGAVIHDLQETILDRYPNMEILVYPAQVQGMASPGSVASALRRCNAEGRAEVVVIARGGGSFEELYAFNTEPVVRAILASRIPVVTALGHTPDRTLADLVADVECRTPTEAGARVVPRKAELQARLEERRRRLEREVGRLVTAHEERLSRRRARLLELAPALVRRRAERLDRLEAELSRLSPVHQIRQRQELLRSLSGRLEAAAARGLRRRAAELAGRDLPTRLERALDRRLQAAEAALAQRLRRLEALSPERVLARGYSITFDETGRVLTSAADTAPGRAVSVRLARGTLAARVVRTTVPSPPPGRDGEGTGPEEARP
ncbi:MAG TPA: exodeoxyribonuclease VII large subunit [Candidatus Dormibacteraeota bacterium]|nr:exodeoxyribonuclease VII large subunit [Candidatus Dormibacteraeota bacterium]